MTDLPDRSCRLPSVEHSGVAESNGGTQSARARFTRDAETRKTAAARSGRYHLARAVKKRATASGGIGPPEVVPLSQSLAFRRWSRAFGSVLSSSWHLLR